MKNAPNLSLKFLTISTLHTDDKKSKFFGNPEEILKSGKKYYENLYTRENVSKHAINESLNKIPRNQISNEHFIICET